MVWTIAKAEKDKTKPYRISSNLGYAQTTLLLTAYETKYTPQPEEFGVFDRNIDAKRHIVEMFEPDLKGCSDEHVKRVSKEYFSGSSRLFKVVKI